MKQRSAVFTNGNRSMHVTIDSFGSYTLARATAITDQEKFVGEGIARRSPMDKYNFNRGVAIATGRALKALNNAINHSRSNGHLLMNHYSVPIKAKPEKQKAVKQ